MLSFPQVPQIGTARASIAALWLLLMSNLVSACSFGSDGGRNYEPPDALCDINIDEKLWDPLFPSGGEVRVDGSGDESSPDYGCTVWVDDEIAIELSTESAQREGGVEQYIRSYNGDLIGGLDVTEAETVEGDGYEVSVWPRVAIAYAECESEIGYLGLITTIWVTDGGDHRDDLDGVIRPYADARADQVDPRWCDATAVFS